ncbi:bifunctional (p)ppGpp synthetase/guanosine-3',5'-bis(diphosphate) 3'-pyrophosphohydrolase [Ahrensia sp. R2A130]|uniref:RelA/SpoT family protein n=1 Tax=Ahrensia sp. R2A130 TaxID=744979 RepID=UPI0001E0A44E|nr:bifunctional (p)ppGpp synthetase/guanosine-3',5'-bis(diphosphate) 3'-pyrophosphohydrolase [Ahrensia sp. R2A130]EFL90662.1 GTP diphosphokinase [Ahrensia sp. R2A130]
MMRQTELFERVQSYIPGADQELLDRAYVYAMHQHRHQTRTSGDPYFTHPLEVASIVTDLKLDQASVVAALLHDTIEDTDSTRAEIDAKFGKEIGELVQGLTKLKGIELVSKKTRQGENLRRLLIAIADDVRVLLVKLADRLHNMRTLHHVPPDKRERISQETMDLYAPLAGRMGMQSIREELEELSFQNLHPDAHALMHEKLAEMRERTRSLVEEIERTVVSDLAAADITATVKSRYKRPYSIFRKMDRNSVSFEQLSDLIGFRVIVERDEECYAALGVVHMRYRAVPERFKDYISTPKQNDYRSLHTTVIGPSNERVELQIRTHGMNEIAEQGIAAHSLYKDGIYNADDFENRAKSELLPESRAYAWLRRTVESLSDPDHPDDVMEQTRLELFHDQVFCFSPKGRLIALPRGSTAIDFAYAVHTDVGNSCSSAQINGRPAPAITQLKNGDEVNIVRGSHKVPPAAWENVVVTGKARAGIRRATREESIQRYSGMGEKILKSTFASGGKTFEPAKLEAVLPKLARPSVADALAAVGRGELPALDVMTAVFPDYRVERVGASTKPSGDGWFNMSGLSGAADFMFRLPGRRREKYAEAAEALSNAIPVVGASGKAVSMNEEIGAVPGDRIVGILKPGEGIVVYPIGAEALTEFEDLSDEWLDLRWDLAPQSNERFPAKIDVIAVNAPGTLARVSDIIGSADANITNLFMSPQDANLTRLVFGVEVWDLKHLSRLLRDIRVLDVVTTVERSMG